MPEKVYMIWDWYDGPREGIADFLGRPHYFKCLFDKVTDEYSDDFELTPVNEATLKLAEEKWNIYCAWEDRHHRGMVDVDTHPGHGGIDPRYDELKSLVDSYIAATPVTGILRGVFRAASTVQAKTSRSQQEVTWE